jgi:tRNA (guanine37-N1)-methyltransferase
MRYDILTLFPEAFDSFIKTSIIGKAVNSNKITINCFNIRDFSKNKHKKVDDVPFGGGAGMVMTCQPLFDSIDYVRNLIPHDHAPVIFFTPHGQTFKQEIAENFTNNSKISRVILLCGHYETIDQRVRDQCIDQEISLGNFILTGGELPAQIFIDATARLLPNVIGKAESHQEESFSQKLGRNTTEYPHYTRPQNFRGFCVPEILLSGHHQKIEDWKLSQCKKQKIIEKNLNFK